MFVVDIMGGLGNQIFQYNFALYLKMRYPKTKIYLNTKYYKTDSIHGGYLLNQRDFPIKNKYRNKQFKIICDNEDFDIDEKTNVIFRGYWQNIKYIGSHTPEFSDLFRLELTDKNKYYLSKIQNHKDSISLHVRCGDYNNNFMHGNIATKAYFQNAIMKISKQLENPSFFVFSDDIEWVKKNIDFSDNKVFYVEGNEKPKDIQYDLYLMSCCNYNIISNSSFSWWGQYFNKNPYKKVIVPPYWVNNSKVSAFKTSMPSIQKFEYMYSVPNIPYHSIVNATPYFSIVLLSFNQEDCIRRAISSVLNQTYQDFELIIVDDCSTDNTPNILKEYEEHNKKIRAKRQPANAGCHLARACGVAAARAKWLLLLDGDDYFFIDALERVKSIIDENPDYDFYEFSYVIRPSGKIISPPKLSVSHFDDFYTKPGFPPTVWNKVYNTKKAQQAFSIMLPLKVNIFEDVCESIVLSYFCKNVKQIDFPIINYLNIQTGISTNNNNDLNKILLYIESLQNTVKDLEHFENICGIDKKLYPLSFVKNRMLDFLFTSIKNQLCPADAIKAYYTIAQLFPLEDTHEFFKILIFGETKQKYSISYKIKREINRVFAKSKNWFLKKINSYK